MVATSAAGEPALPTLDKLNAKVRADLDAKKIATDWFQSFSSKAEAADVDGIISLFLEDSFWRDILSLTWTLRTFHGSSTIKQFLHDRLPNANLKDFVLEQAELQAPYPDLVWIQGLFKFQVGDVGGGDGVFRLVPTSTGEWKVHTVYTNLQSLKGYPEKTGPFRNSSPSHGKWVQARRKEQEFEGVDPYVLVIGGGQSGLDIAARLKFLDVPVLVIEKNARIGDQWRNRYDALCLHDPVWYDHMPYIPFPPSWPVYTPAQKLADWLESYAAALELNVWTSATATSIKQDPETKMWTVVVNRGDKGVERTFHPVHVVLALGLAGGAFKIPDIPGKDVFEGQILHSTQHKSAKDHLGKKVVVVGACTSGHDISGDYAEHGVDVTMVQRSPVYIMSAQQGMPRFLSVYVEEGPPTDIADRIGTSFPLHFLRLIHQRVVQDVAKADRDLLDGLEKRGFQLTFGEGGSGFLLLAYSRGGGYYFDTGSSKKILDGSIKLKSKVEIETFTKKGVKFTDGSELEADVVVFATGFGDAHDTIRKLAGDELTSRLKRIWGLNPEGDPSGVWTLSGVDNLWYIMGNLAMVRYHSRHLALQIKAIREGTYGTAYVM